MNTPSPIFTRLLQVLPPPGGVGRSYLSNEHRPYILQGLTCYTQSYGRAPNGLIPAPNSSGMSAYVTLVEWGTMDPRFSRVPLAAFVSEFPFPIRHLWQPWFSTVPFVVDLAASYLEVPALFSAADVYVFNADLVPADAENIAAAGLKMPRK